MANLTKKQRQDEETIKRMIADAHRRGVCDSYGRSVKDGFGAYIAKPRFAPGSVIQTWRYSPDLGKCVRVR